MPRRELAEELGVGIEHGEPFAEVRAPAALEGVEMWMTVFLTPARRRARPGGRDRGPALVAGRSAASASRPRCATA